MRKSSFPVFNVRNNFHKKETLRNMLSLSMRKSSILVINVNIKLHTRDV